jgi:hypothetical protein
VAEVLAPDDKPVRATSALVDGSAFERRLAREARRARDRLAVVRRPVTRPPATGASEQEIA